MVERLASYFLVGPTCCGKSAVAQCIAEQSGRDIVSADSMLVYAGMDIGTAKPTRNERMRVRYWLIDVVDPTEAFSAGAFREQALAALREIRDAGREAIVVGGSGLYLKALTAGLAPVGGADSTLTGRHWDAVYREEGLGALQDALREKSPRLWADLADRSNPRRLMRALELAEAGVNCFPDQWSHSADARPLIGVTYAPDVLRRRIAERVAAMYENGLLDEAADLRRRYPEWSRTARGAIGYAEAFACLDGVCDVAEAQLQTTTRTRQLAKRQRTWFRTQMNVWWIERVEGESDELTARKVMDAWQEAGPVLIA